MSTKTWPYPNEDEVTIWIVRDVLEERMIRKTTAWVQRNRPGVACVRPGNTGWKYFSLSDYFYSEAAAIRQAEIVRDKEIAKLRKRIAELESIDFKKSIVEKGGVS